MLKRQPGAIHLPRFGGTAKLVDQFVALGKTRRAERMPLGEQSARRIGDEAAAIGIVTIDDELLRLALAAQTERLRLGTGVFLGALHHPIASHEQASTLDQISGGRLMLGVGTGYRDYEFSNFGVNMKTRGRRLNETIELWKKAWTTGSWEWDGEFFHFSDVPVYPPAVQEPHPPIYIGGNSDAAIDRAAKYGDMWFTLPMEKMDVVIAMCDKYRAACAKYGREPRICLMREGWVGENDAAVEREWYHRALSFHRYYWETGTKGDEHDPVLQRVGADENVGMEEFARDRAFAGPPSFIKEEIEQIGRAHV